MRLGAALARVCGLCEEWKKVRLLSAERNSIEKTTATALVCQMLQYR